jgi:DNA repair protein RecN (Recombination protein N)
MLLSISIKNFAIVRELEVHWHNQMTTITGETGAGKSIAIDALSQALGERSEASVVRPGADKAEVAATFDIKKLSAAQNWLKEHDLFMEDECILRRVISKEGRSQGYINGSRVPASQLKQLGNMLVSIHGQHAHQLLTKPEHQLFLLDEYANNGTLLKEVKVAYSQLKSLEKEYKQLSEQSDELNAQKQLLEYQVSELDEMSPAAGEYEEIEAEHTRLHNANGLLMDSQHALDILTENDEGNAYSALKQALNILYKTSSIDSNLASTVELLDSALIQLEEGSSELRRYQDSVELNPERLHEVEQRLSLYVDLARKHGVAPENLHQCHVELTGQLNSISYSDERVEQLAAEINTSKEQCLALCHTLSEVRQEYIVKLNKKITDSMLELNMAGAQFEIRMTTDENLTNSTGINRVEFYVSANPGQPMQPMSKVASGGELSRISLAIQVIIAQRVTTPTLLFDEVDVGVSGPTATAVGKLMNKLSNSAQVICVTHLPQVACYGHQQQFVKKQTNGSETETNMLTLDQEGRIDELARLLAGEQISNTAKANAEELLAIAHAH